MLIKEIKMKKFVTGSLLVMTATLAALTANAHHSFSMFDKDTEMVITGTVASWAFNNPHAWLYVDVVDDSGETVQWGFEGAAPPSLIRRGLTGRTFKSGDTVTVMFCPLVDGRPGGAMAWARLADGSYVSPNDGGCRGGQDSISKWEGWLEQGITSSRDAAAR
jgi:hypothetical protein